MSLTVFRLASSWRPALAQLLQRLVPRAAEPLDYPFAPTDVAQLHRLAPSGEDAGLDDQTWRDLLLDRYADSLSGREDGKLSIFGRQALYRRLRGGARAEERALRRRRIEALLEEDGNAPARLDRLRDALRPLRHAEVEVAELLFDPAYRMPPSPPWLRFAWLLPLALLASLAAVVLSPAAWIAVGAVMYCLVRIQMRYDDGIGAWRSATRTLQMMLRVVSLLDGSGQPLADDFGGRGGRAGILSRGLARSLAAQAVPDAAGYADWFGLANVRHYFRTLAIVDAQRGFLRECYWLCAELEADVALARHLRDVPAWCWAGHADARTLQLEEGVHPLLDGASGLSLALDGKGAFISGQNGAGKSTLLRMLGLNLVTARAFGFCYARRASLPALAVVASMQNEDSLLEGHSLYVAELGRARELLAASGGRQVICLVDEIFRGTNHEESVAAAATVLDELAGSAMVVVSSHNLVLGPLLAHRLDAWRIVRAEEGGLRLEPGVLAQTNGVALLAQHGFEPAIQRKAERVAQWLAGQRHGEVEPVLAPGK
jgi:hypothetical protein